MKILHEDCDGYLIVSMDSSEWLRATGRSATRPRVGNEADVIDLVTVEARLKSARDALLKLYPPEAKTE